MTNFSHFDNNHSINYDSDYQENYEFDFTEMLQRLEQVAPEIISFSIYLALGLFLNILVIMSFAKFSELRNTLTTFLFFTAVSHLLPIVFLLPFQIVSYLMSHWIFGAALCKIVPYIGHLVPVFTTRMLFIVATYTLMAVKFNTFGRIIFQQHHVWKYTCLMAIASCLVCVPVLFEFNIHDDGHQGVGCYKKHEELMQFNQTMLGLLIALLVAMMVFYWTAYRNMKSTPDMRDTVHFRVEPEERAEILEIQTENVSISLQDMKMMWIISVVNGMLQLPSWLIESVSISDTATAGLFLFLRILYILECVLYIIFPMIYGIVSPNFRTCFRKLLCCCCRNKADK
ncbi:hypothetical protein ScPMuIL_005357 [Solemya velum]